jgi:hypothetical protein
MTFAVTAAPRLRFEVLPVAIFFVLALAPLAASLGPET